MLLKYIIKKLFSLIKSSGFIMRLLPIFIRDDVKDNMLDTLKCVASLARRIKRL